METDKLAAKEQKRLNQIEQAKIQHAATDYLAANPFDKCVTDKARIEYCKAYVVKHRALSSNVARWLIGFAEQQLPPV